MFKKILTLALVISLFSISSVAFAQSNTTPHTPAADKTVILTCVASAVTVRESGIQSAFTTFPESMMSALKLRASDLASAWTMTDKAARETAIKTAHTSFKTSSLSAKKAYNTSKQTAWQQFSKARKACKAQPTGESPEIDTMK